jgi:PAS domain S-box-containing protein
MFVLDENFNILVANDVAIAIYGGSLKDVNVRQLRAPGFCEQLIDQMAHAYAAGGGRWETVHVRMDGSRFPVEVRSKYFKIGENVRFIHIVRDITKRKLDEEKIRNLLREKELFLHEVHHRIKNNMTIVMGLLSLQAESLKDSSAAIALRDAGNRMRSMLVLYDQLYRSENLSQISAKLYISQ